MKGILFNVAQEVVTGSLGDDMWDSILDRAGSDGAFTSLGNYDDSQFVALVNAAASVLDVSDREVLRLVGEQAMPLLVERYAAFFAGHSSARDFVLTLNDIIHPEVMKLYPGAHVPEFAFVEAPDGRLIVGYRSERRLCSLAEGFLRGAATHYGESVALEHVTCMLDGAEECRIECRFERLSV